jgi:hypothetical protein
MGAYASAKSCSLARRRSSVFAARCARTTIRMGSTPRLARASSAASCTDIDHEGSTAPTSRTMAAGQRLRRTAATSCRVTPGWRTSTNAVSSPVAIPAMATPLHGARRRAARSRTSLRARRSRATGVQSSPARRCRGRTARVTGAVLSSIAHRTSPRHQWRANVPPHHAQPGDRHVHGQPSPCRRAALACMHFASLSAGCRSPLSCSAEMIWACAALASDDWRRAVIGGAGPRASPTARGCRI